jgi:hypothetical protein
VTRDEAIEFFASLASVFESNYLVSQAERDSFSAEYESAFSALGVDIAALDRGAATDEKQRPVRTRRRFLIRRLPGDSWRKWYPWMAFDWCRHEGSFFSYHEEAVAWIDDQLEREREHPMAGPVRTWTV